ncbi:MAG: hypothetical protein ACPG49_11995 [Chitinophagales bacterium]
MQHQTNPFIIQKFVAIDFPTTIFYVTKCYPCQEVYRAYVTGLGRNRILGFFFEEREGEFYTNSPNANIKNLNVVLDDNFNANYLKTILAVSARKIIKRQKIET